MASTSSSHSNHPDTYDVFLSFRGDDTRYGFTDHLYHALVGAGLYTFRDKEDIERGEEVQREIDTAIIQSRASIVVLSEKYANSTWCLNELWLILEQRMKLNYFVLPVFYHVDPSYVKSICLNVEAKEGSKWTEANVTLWKEALIKVCGLGGDVLSRKTYEFDFIKNVVEKVYCKLNQKEEISTPAELIGMETRVKHIQSLLNNEQYNAVVISGMGGIGKTTLAQCIFDSNKRHFKSSSFVGKIGDSYKHELVKLQKQLYRDLSGNMIEISNPQDGTFKIQKVLQMKKVLIVLDDIDDKNQLSNFLGTNVFHKETKIIVTTRLQGIDEWCGSESWRCKVHELESLNYKESLELLCFHAFPSKMLIKDFEELAKQLLRYCGGNPLALSVLGSSLFSSDVQDPLKKQEKIEEWTRKINSLNSMKGDAHLTIQKVLRTSYDSLPYKDDKELFLHIACFFVGEYEEKVVSILEDDLEVINGIKTLVQRCLLTVSHSRHLVMHQLLQEMGRNIVCEEHRHPEQRTRVWDDNESYAVLKRGKGSNTIEGLSLDIFKVNKQKTITLRTRSIAKMEKLKFLRLSDVRLSGPYKNFPELRWLCWHGFTLKTIPVGLLMSSLVALDMSYGDLEKFEAPVVLGSLKTLNLEDCDELVSICSLHQLPNLQSLTLCGNKSLIHLCESIRDLKSLVLLDLKGCNKLLKTSTKEIDLNISPKRPRIDGKNSKQPLFSLPSSLKTLNLCYCNIDHPYECPVAFHPQSFFQLSLGGNSFELLPSTIDLKLLQSLDLYSCSILQSLPCIPSTLKDLYIDWCWTLETITFQSGHFSLRQFSYEGCSSLNKVQGLFVLSYIAQIKKADLLDHMQWIKAYDKQEVDLVGDVITYGRDRRIQLLQEYDITSTYLQGINDQSMMISKNTSSSSFVSLKVPSHHINKIQGIQVSCLYRSSGSKDLDMRVLLAKVSIIHKGLTDFTWVYNPIVYCKPCVDEDVLWLSYWPIKYKFDDGDEVHVHITVDEEVIVTECSASLVYIDGVVEVEEINESDRMEEEEVTGPDLSKFKEEEHSERNKKKEVLGGDLTAFEVTPGSYYLCRRDLFGSETISWLKRLFGDNINYTESQGWKNTRQYPVRSSELTRCVDIQLSVDFNNKSEIDKIVKAVYSTLGDHVTISINSLRDRDGKQTASLLVNGHFDAIKLEASLLVNGHFDAIKLEACVKKFDSEAFIMSIDYY